MLFLKKLITILLLIILSINLLGTYGIFRYHQFRLRREIKRQIKNGVKEEELLIFNFEINELEKLTWTKPNEFKIGSRFYDIVRKEINKGLIVLFCIDDKRESILFSKLDDIVKNRANQSGLQQLIKKVFQLKSYQNNHNTLFSLFTTNNHKLYIKLKYNISAGFLNPTIKPPCISTIN